MANVEKRVSQDGSLSFRVKVRIRGHRPVSATFSSLTKAKRWATQTESAIRERRYFRTAAAEKHTVANLIDRFIANDLASYPKMQRMMGGHLRWWRSELGHLALIDLTPSEIVGARDKLARLGPTGNRRPAPGTVNRYLASLSIVASRAAKEWGWLEDNPMRKVSKLREPSGRDRFLSTEEREALLAACKDSSNSYLYTIVVVAISTAARRGEILNLSWRDVDLKGGSIALRETKNGEPRAVPLRGHALELLRTHARIRRLDTELLFPSERTPKKPIEFRDPWNKAVKKANLTNFRFHDLRHTAASYLAMNGASPLEIAAVLGHKTLQMVKRYAHLSKSHTSELVERMNTKVFG